MRIKIVLETLAVAALVMVFGGEAQAQLAKQGTFKTNQAGHWAGTNYAVGKDHIFWIGTNKGVVLNKKGGFLHNASYVCATTADIDGPDVETGGYCIYTDEDSDQIFLRSHAQSTTGGAGAEITHTKSKDVFVGGTGKYQGIAGNMECTYQDVAFRETGSYIEGEGLFACEGRYRLP
ncbi:MAG: hypothetical protein JSU95_03555 [Betaproteobacteria bacterium]|nr:MAG: hypothetical protein JSU95_03555 [Betaproteobacteria bacterium]